MLEALPGAPVSTLVLYGGVPLSGAVASAVASSFKCLTDVRFDFRWGENDLPHGAPDGDGASEYYYGAMKLLALCGPRLTGLRLNGGVQQWPMLAFQALRECTALTRLELDAGRKETDGCHKNGPYLGRRRSRRMVLHPSCTCYAQTPRIVVTSRHARHADAVV